MNRTQRRERLELWADLRRDEVAAAKRFFYGIGSPGGVRANGPSRLLFVIGDKPRAGVTTFLREIRREDERAIALSCGSKEDLDPIFHALQEVLWRALATDESVPRRFVDALETHSALDVRPAVEDVRRMVQVATHTGRGLPAPPRMLRRLLPIDFEDLVKIVEYTAAPSSTTRRFFIDDAVLTDNVTIRGAIDAAASTHFRFAIGMRWANDAVALIDEWKHRHPTLVGVWKLSDAPPQELGRETMDDPFRKLFFTFDLDRAPDGTTNARMHLDETMAAFFARAIAALDGMRREDVESVAAVLHAEDGALRELLANQEVLMQEEGEYRVRRPWTHQGTLEGLIDFIEEMLARRTDSEVDVPRLLLQVARRDAKRARGDQLAAVRAVLLAVIAKYVRSTRTRDQEETATAAELLAQQLTQLTQQRAPGARHLSLLDELFHDSANLSIVDHGLTILADREGAPLAEELRFLRTACAGARRYSDRLVALALADLLPSERLREWVVPAEIELAGIALKAAWNGDDVLTWVGGFAERLREFAMTPGELCDRIFKATAETIRDAGARSTISGRSPRKANQAARKKLKRAKKERTP